MWDYTDKVREHFLNPRNVGSLDDANAIGEVGSLACGDALKLYLKIDDEGRIQDARFQTFGCASAIASSSALTELIKGMLVEDALKISNKDIAAHLGGLPKEKMHCSVMGQEALEAAIRNWRGEPAVEHAHEGKLVCKCFGITDEQIIRAIRENNLKTVEDITHFTKAGGGCGDCLEEIRHILDVELGKEPECLTPLEPPKKLTNVQRMQLVMKVLDGEIRPRLQQDGGDIELVDMNGTEVMVALRGMCTSCPSSQLTLKEFVERTLRDHVDQEIVVREVSA
ncbi:Fe-S cluster assembly protein NifU [Nitratidesulfovibrio vulgaris]|jgi:NifU-like protein|uniref:Nitrogen fixation protein NifU n=2 Tax=Nitratidesulfovibrio vulgaris TaxID=881 RepID=Q72EB3_NITV2|nr:Fe-S cluster assembly protein NifU [Nitratidesulfovibrio vulgaris]GEB79954.1 nitrogen fixation protein NifU [Desulfovibrio desulfuricans]HBW15329.1 Fe-S cluster assembly protein NifU [Desulfovibrio sp.]AAS95146.1 nitrogen fixation protein nifU [Nitratidesulfovibrio vulgaris str. Hildenborough]ABM29311.1 Fe-S cluster assembly protein NifU [Nitratidesulfovibrio vulgaris DP4]ADP85779.1 Fe-S cluster assembly protein NifU [Nitratidesulfovibrio vulgaris RCH1]